MPTVRGTLRRGGGGVMVDASLKNKSVLAQDQRLLEKARLTLELARSAARQKIAERKVWTSQLRDRVNEVTAQFEVLDKLVLPFGQTTAGRAFVAAHQSARLIRSTGGPTLSKALKAARWGEVAERRSGEAHLIGQRVLTPLIRPRPL